MASLSLSLRDVGLPLSVSPDCDITAHFRQDHHTRRDGSAVGCCCRHRCYADRRYAIWSIWLAVRDGWITHRFQEHSARTRHASGGLVRAAPI